MFLIELLLLQIISSAYSILAYSRKTLLKSNRMFADHALSVLGYNFIPRPNNHALGTVGSAMTVNLSVNGCSHTDKPV